MLNINIIRECVDLEDEILLSATIASENKPGKSGSIPDLRILLNIFHEIKLKLEPKVKMGIPDTALSLNERTALQLKLIRIFGAKDGKLLFIFRSESIERLLLDGESLSELRRHYGTPIPAYRRLIRGDTTEVLRILEVEKHRFVNILNANCYKALILCLVYMREIEGRFTITSVEDIYLFSAVTNALINVFAAIRRMR